MSDANSPAKLPTQIVSEIRSREGRNGLVRLPEAPRYRNGDRVGIVRGLFKGKTGIYAGSSGKDRERVLLDLLGRSTMVDLARADLTPPA